MFHVEQLENILCFRAFRHGHRKCLAAKAWPQPNFSYCSKASASVSPSKCITTSGSRQLSASLPTPAL
jgi:hypothetical protein